MRARKHDLANWLRGLPPRLQEAFASQIGQLRYSDEGQALARELIGADGPFGDLLAERQPWAREAFLALGSVERNEALARLETWLRSDETAGEELSRDANLERLLFRLIWRTEHYARSFRLILRGLAASADPTKSGLHRVLAGSLSITLANSQAPFPERFAVAARAVRDTTLRPEVRRLVLRAVATGVGHGTGDGYSQDDVDVGGRTYWHPKTHGDWWECTRSVVKLLVEMLGDSEEGMREEAAANLIDHAAEFIRGGAHEPFLAAIKQILAVDPRVGKLREELDRCIAFDQVAEDVNNAVRVAIAALPQDLATRIRVLVEGWPLVNDREERGLPERPEAIDVASEIMASPDREAMIGLLFQSWARNAGGLITVLAQRPDAIEAWPPVFDAARKTGETWGAALFLAVAHNTGADAFRRTAVELLASSEQYDANLGAEAITRMEPTDEDAAELVRAVRIGRVRPSSLRYAIMGRWTERRSPAVIADLIRATAAQIDGRTTALAIIHAAEANMGLSDAEIIEVLASCMFDVRGHDAWTWQEIGAEVAIRTPLALGTALIARIGERAQAREYQYTRWSEKEVSGVLDQCIDAAPALVRGLLELWECAPDFVESSGGGAMLQHLDAQTLGDWAVDVPRQRALAHIVVAAPHPTTEALLDRFGADSHFAATLREQLYPRFWSGSLATLLQSRAEQTRGWSADATKPHEFREWARDASTWLDDAAKRAKPYDD